MSAQPQPTAAPEPGRFTPQAPQRLHSSQWFRMSGLKPRLLEGVVVRRQALRGAVWQTLVRADGARSVRLNAAGWAAVGRCDGQRTVAELWEGVVQAWGDAAPTQDAWLLMLGQLHGAGLLGFDRRVDFGDAQAASPRAGAEAEARQRARTARSPLALRWSLGSPQAWLDRWAPRLRGLQHPAVGAAWALLLLWAVGIAWTHAGALTQALQEAVQRPSNWLGWVLMALAAKLLHEAAHGITAHWAGARVPDAGVSLLMLAPMPYVDASAASALPRRRDRMRVAAAGALVEGVLAAFGLAAWLQLQPGPLRDAALGLIAICGVTSLLVNLNPLLRFDGYHLLSDALQLPNWAPRSQRWWREAAQRLLTRAPLAQPLAVQPGERGWLIAYAPASWLMRLAVSWGLVVWMSGLSRVAGALLALVLAWALFVQPLRRALRWLLQASDAGTRRRGALALGAVVLLLAVLPLPHRTLAPGVLWQEEGALLRAPEAGQIEQYLVADGQWVEAGTPIVALRVPAVDMARDAAQARLERLTTEYQRALHQDPSQAGPLRHAVEAAAFEHAQWATREGERVLRAQQAGRVAIVRAADAPGRPVARGALLAHLVTGQPAVVQVALPHEQLGWAQQHQGPATVWVPGNARQGGWTAQALLDGAWSGAGRALPQAALGEAHGGPLPVDPADASGLTAREPVALAQWRLDHPVGERIGQRVWLRLDHGWAPLLWQGLQRLQQQWLHHANPVQ